MFTTIAFTAVVCTVLSVGYAAFDRWVLPWVDRKVAEDIAREIGEIR